LTPSCPFFPLSLAQAGLARSTLVFVFFFFLAVLSDSLCPRANHPNDNIWNCFFTLFPLNSLLPHLAPLAYPFTVLGLSSSVPPLHLWPYLRTPFRLHSSFAAGFSKPKDLPLRPACPLLLSAFSEISGVTSALSRGSRPVQVFFSSRSYPCRM